MNLTARITIASEITPISTQHSMNSLEKASKLQRYVDYVLFDIRFIMILTEIDSQLHFQMTLLYSLFRIRTSRKCRFLSKTFDGDEARLILPTV